MRPFERPPAPLLVNCRTSGRWSCTTVGRAVSSTYWGVRHRMAKTYYQRHLPHYQPADATYFVTFRLAGSLPQEAIKRLKDEREHEERILAGVKSLRERRGRFHEHREAYFKRFEALLDGATTGPQWLRQDAVATLVCRRHPLP